MDLVDQQFAGGSGDFSARPGFPDRDRRFGYGTRIHRGYIASNDVASAEGNTHLPLGVQKDGLRLILRVRDG
ncbi:MAG: hypothetical protein H6805_07425 [Planctomycetes bacterium]|nr:hypothetical protein [Planctomycetota bacterium]MCB9825646.1 hypothetical protein [Planctomycetota bacterium]